VIAKIFPSLDKEEKMLDIVAAVRSGGCQTPMQTNKGHQQ
jgi:hypothetical protein